MRIAKKPKIKFKYIGDESPEKKIESERILESVYNRIFSKAFDHVRKNKQL